VDSGRRVVVYSHHAGNATAIKCLDLGALAHLTKREGPEDLIPAIRAAARGMSYPAPPLSGTDSVPARPHLSPREVEVLRAWFASMAKDGVITLTELNQATL
jgi:DNA-binding NarL/FixJ family response regulator